MRKNKVDIITLGCSKNLVDSEQLMRQFVANGYTVEHKRSVPEIWKVVEKRVLFPNKSAGV